jgi:hypothetical protein
MNSWFERRRRRRRNLAHGADADLVRDNRRRYRLAFGLLGLGTLLWFFGAEISVLGVLHSIVVALGMVSFVAGLFLAAWAQQVDAFLSKPDPEEPPRIFKL